MKLLGDNYGAKYFAMMSSHCAFTRRGGHGHDYHGNWSSWAASLCGPEVRILNERNLRWRRTLCRMFDGSFVYHSPTGTTAPCATRPPPRSSTRPSSSSRRSSPARIPNEALYPTEREMKQLLASARAQFNDPWLKERAGTPWQERSTDEVFDLLDIFIPEGARTRSPRNSASASRPARRTSPPRLVELLESDEPRFRDGALRGPAGLRHGHRARHLSKLTTLLEDPKDFVRITAVQGDLEEHRQRGDPARDAQGDRRRAEGGRPEQRPQRHPDARSSPRTTMLGQHALRGRLRRGTGAPGARGSASSSTRSAARLHEHRASTSGPRTPWCSIAGPLTFAAEEEQIVDQMFANRCEPAQALLGKFGYREASEATAHRLRKQGRHPAATSVPTSASSAR